MMKLPDTALPTNYCCAYDTHLRGTRLWVRELDQPPRTTSRWAIVVRWQCHVDPHHNGEWYELTDDPEKMPPFRTVDDPSHRQRIVGDPTPRRHLSR